MPDMGVVDEVVAMVDADQVGRHLELLAPHVGRASQPLFLNTGQIA